MDKVFIKDLHVLGIIGIYEHERTRPQEMVISVTMFTDTRVAGASDRIEDCVSYELVANQIRAHAQRAHRLTVEALAEDIARLCLLTSGVERVQVRVEKPEAITDASAVGVEIEREKA